MEIEIQIETAARHLAAVMLAVEGWNIRAREVFGIDVRSHLAPVALAVAVEAIPALADAGFFAEADARSKPIILAAIYADDEGEAQDECLALLPIQHLHRLGDEALKAVRDAGVAVLVLKDDAGDTFIITPGSGRAGDCDARPVGGLHRLH